MAQSILNGRLFRQKLFPEFGRGPIALTIVLVLFGRITEFTREQAEPNLLPLQRFLSLIGLFLLRVRETPSSTSCCYPFGDIPNSQTSTLFALV